MASDAHDKSPRGPGSASIGLGVIPERVARSQERKLWLRCTQGRRAGTRLAVTRDHAMLGRHDSIEKLVVDIDLSDYEATDTRTSISRQHAEIVRTEAGWHLVDLNSANGTQVDGQRLKPGQPHPLRHGSLVTLGRLEFTVEED